MPFAMVNGTTLHYHETGHGLPIVFIHPPLLNQEIFNYQKAQLADSYRIITFDIRGHGLSPYSPQPIAYPLIAEDIRQLLDFLDIRQAVVCGYSTGGTIALEAMLAYPDRFAGGVLLSAMSQVSDWLLKSRIRLASGMSGLKLKRLLGGGIGWGNSDMSQTFGNLYKGAVQGDSRNIRQYYSYSLGYSCTHRLHAAKQPVLLLYGQEDTAFHRYARILEERLPNSELVFIEKVAHQLPTKAPRALHRLLDQWMKRHFDVEDSPADDLNIMAGLGQSDPAGPELQP